MNIKTEDTCSFCKNAPETILHLFWNCEIIQTFWTGISNYIKNKCNIDLLEWDANDILFGSYNFDKVVNLLLLQAKHFIYYNRIKNQMPSIEGFSKQIVSCYRIDKYNAKQNFKITEFDRDWERYKNLTHTN